MPIYTKVVNSNVKTSSICTSIQGSMRTIGAAYVFVNGQRKKLYPDYDPTSDPTVEYTSAGTYTVTLPPGYYKFTI